MKDDGTSSAAEMLSPRLLVSASSRVQELEKFSHYVGMSPQICSCFVPIADGGIGIPWIHSAT